MTSSGFAARRLWLGSAGLALSAAFLVPMQAGADSPPITATGPKLSGHTAQATWAHPVRRAPIRRAPRPGGGRITSTHFNTEDGFPEVYPVLRSLRVTGTVWLKIRIPMRPNGRIGWVRATALGPLYPVRTLLVVNRRRPHATLYRDGRRVWTAPIGVGKSSTPTPAGRFWIREKFRTRDPGGLYGPMAFGTSDYSVLTDWPGGGVIGVHGTDEPSLIPGRPSHGCIRVRNRAVRRLWRLMPIGTNVLIR